MRLEAAPGVGPVLATALVAAVAGPKSFRSGRNFSVWIGMVPKQHSSGGKNRLGNISRVTAICAAYLWPARFLSSATPRSMASNIGLGSRPC
ncbi:transposase [Bradyrhizobium sp. AUGA SZCCT0158]|uniref:transposase n=1 Tax=Bradyrhizobium sp. AUGA SZCCT0158 TaxID=2807661 RepID=UPI00390C6412